MAIASGCSLLDLGDFDLQNCVEKPGGSPCEALNEAHGVPERACSRWQCRLEGPGCEWRPKDSDNDGQPDAASCADEVTGDLDCDDDDGERAHGLAETCDRKDNDCDQNIDESLPVLGATSSVALTAGSELRFLASTQDTQGDVYILSGSRDGEWRLQLVILPEGGLEARESRAEEVAVSLADRRNVSGDGACVKASGSGALSGNACRFVEVGLAAVGGTMVAAGVDTGASGLGYLRAGVLAERHFELGVETLEPEGDPEFPGFQAPRIAGRPDGGEALLVWQTLGRRSDGGTCLRSEETACDATATGCGATELRAIPLETSTSGERRTSVAMSESGEFWIGRSASSAAPAVSTFRVPHREGYLVAFAGNDSVELFSRAWLSSEAAGERRGSLRAGGRVTGIALARASEASEREDQPSAVAWRTGCGGGSSVQLARLTLASNAEAWTPLSTVTLRNGANIVAGPWLQHVDDGIRASERSGGWFVTWVEAESGDRQRLMARRVAEETGKPAGDVLRLASGSSRFAFSFTHRSRAVRYGYVTADRESGTQLRIAEATCVLKDD